MSLLRHAVAAIALLVTLLPDPAGANAEMTAQLPGGTTMAFVWIEPGTFTMGSPLSETGRSSSEGPQHRVTISRGFWLGQYELTQGQWAAVMDTIPWSDQSYVEVNPSCPAAYISWDDVQDLIRRLNKDAGQVVYRLPTEAEWEYACRAGTSTAWSFGEDEGQLGSHAWYDGNAWNAGSQFAQPVGTKLANPWGLFDMHGNVWEWCHDGWYRDYTTAPLVDPQAPAAGTGRVIRGGSFAAYARYTRSAYHRADSPDYRSADFGARLVRGGPGPTAVSRESWGAVKKQAQP